MNEVLQKLESLMTIINLHASKATDVLEATGKYDKEFIEYHRKEYSYSFVTLQKYHKIVSHGSVVAFIDRETGDIFKPASWKAPAKGIRGNVLSEKNGTEAFDFQKDSSIVNVVYWK